MSTHNPLTGSRRRLSNVQERRALEVFEALIEQADSARAAILEALSAEDAQVAQRVSALLSTHRSDADRLPTAPPDPVSIDTEEPPPPERIGVFKLGELLGRGGMGSVYRAERCDGLFEHVVAIKLMRATRTSTLALQAFESERRNLARLQHPNIAQLYDGGDLPDGRAYIVMEQVVGKNIVDHVRDERLDQRAVLDVFAATCRAVQAAHQQLIVHADLKPSNILVGSDGVPKLLDFGVSRLLVTADGRVQSIGNGSSTALTAAYASPERRRGDPPSIVDDVYSLGIILQELLTGRRPSQESSENSLKLPADLRAIIDKASANDSARRYSGVNALLTDLQRYANDEPVTASEPTPLYRMRCFFRRHRLGVTMASAALVALVGALLFTSQLYARAEAARLKADNRYSEVRQLSNYMLGDLQSRLTSLPQSLPLRKEIIARGETYTRSLAVDATAPPDVQLDAIAGLTQLAEMQGVPGHPNVGDATSARQSLQRALQVIERLWADQVAPVQVAVANANVAIDLAALEVTSNNDVKSARRWLLDARRNLDFVLSNEPHNVAAAHLNVEWMLRSADVANWDGDFKEGERLARLAIDKLQQAQGSGLTPRNQSIALARAWDSLGEAIYYRGDYASSVAPYLREIEIIDAAGRSFPGDVLVERNRLRAYWSLGTTYLQIRRHQDALQTLSTATAIGKELARQEPNDAEVMRNVAITDAAYGQALAAVGRYDTAIDILTNTVEQREKLAREHPEDAAHLRDYAISLTALADLYGQSGNAGQACKLLPQARAVYERLREEGRNVALSESYSIKQLQASEQRFCMPRGSA